MPQATLSQRSKYIHGILTVPAGETKSVVDDATWEDVNGAVAAAPNGLRGWLATVESGSAEILVRAGGTIGFTSPTGAHDDPTASDVTGVWFREKSGSAQAVIKIRAIVGGIS